MTRTVDPTLAAALAAGSGKPLITAYLGTTAGGVGLSATPTRYKLTGSSLEFEIPVISNTAYPALWLKRGVTLASGDYTLTTGRFRTTHLEYTPGRIFARGELFPTEYYSANGNDTYQNVITAFCSAYGKTAVFREPADAWLGYRFFPPGKGIILNNANSFLNLLRQKYLIFAADNGNEEVLFYSCAYAFPAVDKTYTPAADYLRAYTYRASRYFMWRDELGTIHTDGTATDPIHNLGFLESTTTPPDRHLVTWGDRLTIRPDLAVMDGDIVNITVNGGTVTNYALVTEEYTAPDRSHAHPRWFTTIEHNSVFTNTEGGAMPSTIERVSNYTPLNTSQFNKLLSASDNNLQAAMDRIDNHHQSVKVYNSANLVSTSAVFKTLTWDSEEWDDNAMHDVATNTERLIAQTPGIYDVVCQAEFAANATGRRALVIYKVSGGVTTSLATTKVMPCTDAGATTIFQCIARVSLAVGDYVYAAAFQASGGNLNITGSPAQTWMHMALN